MTQRIFDIENKKDYADLWDILSDDAVKITKHIYHDTCDLILYNGGISYESPFAINWHDKTEITRPIQEATEHDIGKICYFWDNDKLYAFGMLSNIYNGENDKYKMSCGNYWEHCRRLTKEEVSELC